MWDGFPGKKSSSAAYNFVVLKIAKLASLKSLEVVNQLN